MPVNCSYLVEKIESSREFREFRKAFRDATGLPLEITEVNKVKFALCSRNHGSNDFCKMMAGSGYHCDTCRKLNHKITRELGLPDDTHPFNPDDSEKIGWIEKNPSSVSGINEEFWSKGPRTFECFAGMCESMVPIRANNDIVGFLKTGQVLVQKPTKKAFRRAIETIKDLQIAEENKRLEESYFKTPVLPVQQYEAMVMLLKSFSDQLSTFTEKTLIAADHTDPTIVQKAKEIIQKCYSDPLTLEEIAQAVPVSPFHLSRKFKESNGIGAMEYLTRVRIDRAKEALIKKDVGIAEIAFEVGFQSLAPFNKAFKKMTGMSPKAFRNQ